MDINSFLVNLIAIVVGNIPALIGVVSTVAISLNRIKNTTSSFPEAVGSLKDDLLALFGASSKALETAFLKSTADFSAMFVSFKAEMKTLVADSIQQIVVRVNDTLTLMQKELSTFNSILLSNRDHVNFLAVENKLYIDALIALVAKDPQLVRDGVASVLSARLNRTKEELESFPLNLVTNPAAFESALRETLQTIGREKFEEMLRNAGYGTTQKL